MLITLAILIANQSLSEYKVIVKGAMNLGLTPIEIKEIIDSAKILPVLIQVECHPYFQEKELKEFLKPYDIKIESWYPLGHGDNNLINEQLFAELAEKYNKTNVQIILKWHIQDGNIVIPKATNSKHILDNINIFDFKLSKEDMEKIKQIDKNQRYFNLSEEEQEKKFYLGYQILIIKNNCNLL